ncbi:MAG: HAD-IA family hydrolase, partial [Gammaproteobacteria bacterium]|nr:HAD-IA family hydrolase [Gammaproteobacteria bacterium]
MAIRVVTFDLDNTLWDVDQVIRRAEAQLRAWLADRVPEYEDFDRDSMMAIRKELIAESASIAHDLSALRTQVMFEVIKRCGYDEPAARRYATDAFEVFIHARHDVEYFADALEVLRQLSKRYQLGALTNGNADFQRLGLDKYFSFGFSSADVGASKPDPAMFQATLAHTQSEPQHVVHIGDHPV